MRVGFKYAATAVSLLILTAGFNGLFALCTEADNVFPIFQCGFTAWFAPLPAVGPSGKPTGAISGAWWQLSYGNFTISNGIVAAAQEGTGITPLSPLTFSGNDSGMGGITLTPANSVLPQPGVPAGAQCINFEDSWAEPGVDGCADSKRTTAAYDNDNLLNPYWGGSLGPGTLNMGYQLDYPVAFLLREGSGQFFSLAMLASKTRNADPADTSQGVFDLGEVTNGEPNPVSGQLDQIPWQQVPKPNVQSAVIGGGGANVTVALQWNNVKLVHDNSARPSARLTDTATGGGDGVGVTNQINRTGGFVRYRLEMLNLTTLPPGSVNPITGEIDPAVLATAVFTPVPGVPNPIPAPAGTQVVTQSATVPRDHALRIRTLLGVTPRTTGAGVNVANCRLGRCGDLGIEATDCGAGASCVSSPLTVVGGALISERAIEIRAAKQKGQVAVSFRTTSEQTVTGIDILGVGNKGDFVLKSVQPQQGNSGVGAQYEVTLAVGDLKGAKQIKVRLNGPNNTSDPVSVE